MKIVNYMEDMVKEQLEEILAKRDDICKCQKCKFDIIVLALNRLPPRYVVTEKGRIYTKLQEQVTQFKADVIRELAKAIIKVNKNIQHQV